MRLASLSVASGWWRGGLRPCACVWACSRKACLHWSAEMRLTSTHAAAAVCICRPAVTADEACAHQQARHGISEASAGSSKRASCSLAGRQHEGATTSHQGGALTSSFRLASPSSQQQRACIWPVTALLPCAWLVPTIHAQGCLQVSTALTCGMTVCAGRLRGAMTPCCAFSRSAATPTCWCPAGTLRLAAGRRGTRPTVQAACLG